MRPQNLRKNRKGRPNEGVDQAKVALVVGVLAGVEMGNARSEKKTRKEAATAKHRDRGMRAATAKAVRITPRVRPQVNNPASADRAVVEVVLEGKAHVLILATNNRIRHPRAVLTHHQPLLRRSRAKPAPKAD